MSNHSFFRLTLIRHGARAPIGDQLSAQGEAQAAALVDRIRAMPWPAPTQLIASPKNRTKATLRNLSEALVVPISVDASVDEQTELESNEGFDRRVQIRIGGWHEIAVNGPSPGNAATTHWLVCSHMDWLENAAIFLDSDESDFDRTNPWPPLSLRSYAMVDGLWRRNVTAGDNT